MEQDSSSAHDDVVPQEGSGTTTATAVAEETSSRRADEAASGATKDEPAAHGYRISLRNMKKFPGYRAVGDWIATQTGVAPRRVYTKGKHHHMVIYAIYTLEEDQQKAVAALNNCLYKGEPLVCRAEEPPKDPLVEQAKRANDGSNSQQRKKRAKHMDPSLAGLTPEQRVSRAVEPYKQLPYEDQLKKKQDSVSIELKSITTLLGRNTLVPPWLPKQKAANKGQVCELLDILESPSREGYRIKNEFTIGPGPDDEQSVTVGFHLGMYKEGSVTIASPSECSIVPEAAQKVAKVFQEYARQSELLYYDERTHLGYWKTLTVRTPTAGGCMVIAQLHPQKMLQPEVEEEMEQLRKYFQHGDGQECGITSMYLNFETDRYKKSELKSYYHVFGDEHIYEKLLGLTYQISPDSFFQINTPATERLYSLICDWCDVSEDSVVLDVCCGTGTIALALAKRVKKVIGIEIVEQAVEDAKKNAELNGISNAEFICGAAEHVMPNLIKRFGRQTKLIAVVDPPRAGLPQAVVAALRKCSALKRIVYVACDIRKSKDNIMFLCKPPNNHVSQLGFIPIKAVPIDMFPHTPHCELAMVLERLPPPRLSDFIDQPATTPQTDASSEAKGSDGGSAAATADQTTS